METVLIVDDEFGLAEMASELLAMAGFAVATAIKGRMALATIEQLNPDLVRLDVMMPIMSGADVLEAMRANPAMQHIPVIMMSAAGREAVPEHVLPLISGFLTKPFTYDELMTAVRHALRARG